MASFEEYLNARGKVEEKPKVAVIADKLEVEPKSDPKAAGKGVSASVKKGGKHAQIKEADQKESWLTKLRKAFHKEYVDESGKLVERPATEIIPDYKGNTPNAPVKANGMSEPAPYKSGKDASYPKGEEEGLANKGDKNLVYNPDTKEGDSENIPGGRTVKTKTEDFLDKTRGLNLQEFTRYIIECGCSSSDSFQKIREVAALSVTDTRSVDNLVHEFKRAGLLSKLIEAVLDHPESYGEITALLGAEGGSQRYKSLVNSLNKFLETVGPPPVGMDDIDDDESEHGDPDEFAMKHGNPDDEMNPHDEDDEDSEDSDEDSDEMDDDSDGSRGDMGDMDMGSQEGDDMGSQGSDMGSMNPPMGSQRVKGNGGHRGNPFDKHPMMRGM